MNTCRTCKHMYDLKFEPHTDHRHYHNSCRLCDGTMDTDTESYGIRYSHKCNHQLGSTYNKYIDARRFVEDGGAM